MKIEIGMYCYNKTNRKLGIGKIINFEKNNNILIRYKNDTQLLSIGNIVASFDIINLVEVGDYVNGIRIDGLSSNRFTGAKAVASNLLENKVGAKCYFFENKDIKSIITREQIEQVSYKVVE